MKEKQTRLCRVMSHWMLEGGVKLTSCVQTFGKTNVHNSTGKAHYVPALVCKNVIKLHSAIHVHDS